MERRACFVLSLFLLIFFASRAAIAETITVRADAWPPYNGDPASSEPGYVVELLKLIFEKAGHSIDYQTMPWNRTLQEVKQGKFDAAIGASTEDGAGMVFPGEPAGKMDTCFFVRKDNPWRYTGIASLKAVKLGVIDEYDYGSPELNEWVKQKKGTPEVQAATGDDAVEKNIQKLLAGRMDVLLEAKAVVEWTLKKLKAAPDQVVQAGELGNPTEIYVVFSPAKPSSKQYADIFSKGIQELRQSGELKKTLDKYGVTDWK